MAWGKRGRDVTRLEAFSDAVFAFSATLLVVSLEVPETFSELLIDLKGFAAFGLSFMALMLIWSVHNAYFRRYGLQDNWTILLNSCLLFVVLFYVYPLKFVVRGLAYSVFGMNEVAVGISSWDELSLLFMLYSAGFVAIFLCVTLMYGHAYRRRADLDLTPEEVYEARFFFRHYLILVTVGVASILIAWAHLGLVFGLPGLVYIALGPLCYGHSVISNKRRPVGEDALQPAEMPG